VQAGAAGMPPPPPPPGSGARPYAANPAAQFAAVDSRTASLLCYIPVVGWIMAIVVLSSTKYRNDLETRFHAFQGLYLFVAWLITDWVLAPVLSSAHMHVGWLLKAFIVGCWVFMLIKVSHRERFKLPFIGDLAEKSVTEQGV
jgi:uncharacterized membrane protein